MEIGLNLGCGGVRIPDTNGVHFINVDTRTDVAADVILDCTKTLPYETGTISVIISEHMLEHLPRLVFPVALKEWFRVLKSGGTIIIEVPNFDGTVKEYLEAVANNDIKKMDQRIENVYGRQFFEGDQHCWGFNLFRLKRALESVGFTDVEEMTNYSYHATEEPCVKVIARKP